MALSCIEKKTQKPQNKTNTQHINCFCILSSIKPTILKFVKWLTWHRERQKDEVSNKCNFRDGAKIKIPIIFS